MSNTTPAPVRPLTLDDLDVGDAVMYLGNPKWPLARVVAKCPKRVRIRFDPGEKIDYREQHTVTPGKLRLVWDKLPMEMRR